MITITARCQIYEEDSEDFENFEIKTTSRDPYKFTVFEDGEERPEKFLTGYVKNKKFIVTFQQNLSTLEEKKIHDKIESLREVLYTSTKNSSTDLTQEGKIQAYSTCDEITSKFLIGKFIVALPRDDTIQTALEFQRCYKSKFDKDINIYLVHTTPKIVKDFSQYYQSKFKYLKFEELDVKDNFHMIVAPTELNSGQTKILDQNVYGVTEVLSPRYLFLQNDTDFIIPTSHTKKIKSPKRSGDIQEINLNLPETTYFLNSWTKFNEINFYQTMCYSFKDYRLYMFMNLPYLSVGHGKVTDTFFPIYSIYDGVPELVPAENSKEHIIVSKLLTHWGMEFLVPYFPNLYSLFLSFKLGFNIEYGNFEFKLFLERYPIFPLELSETYTENLEEFNTIPEKYDYDIQSHSLVFKTALNYLAQNKKEISLERKEKIIKNFPQIVFTERLFGR